MNDRIIVSPDETRSIKKCKGSSPIPTDLIIEIFSRLPSKSVVRYRCLSKLWSKVISSQYFIDLFAAKSSARPQILFLRINHSGISFFSAHQPSDNSSDNIALTHLTHYPLSSRYNPSYTYLLNNLVRYHNITVPINSLICFRELVIHNPSTGESLHLPTRRKLNFNMRNFLAYDPIEKQFKVLSLDHPPEKQFERGSANVFVDIQVLTLETKELSWRTIEGCKFHMPVGSEICINGVLYYRSFTVSFEQLIVCFDVRSETFRFVKIKETLNQKSFMVGALINYHGKLGLLIHEESHYYISGENKSFELWILKDAEKYEWSKYVYVLPPLWKTFVGETMLSFVGMIGTNEIILSPGDPGEPPCFFYYNIGKGTIRKFNIQSMEGLTTSGEVHMFLNHVEDVSLLKLLN